MLLDQYGRPMPSPARRAAMAIRARRRAQIDAAYDAAQTTEENVRHWRWADDLSAAAANSHDVRAQLRARARYETANNSFAQGIVDTLANDTIGTGPRIQVETASPEANRVIEERWNAWCRARRIGAKLRTARRAKCVDGEVFLQATTARRSTMAVQLDVRVIEADQFHDPNDQMTNPSHMAGVHFDSDGIPEAYDRLPHHPGDAFGHVIAPVRVPADDVIHLFREDRPGQIRGIPEITPALPLFAMLRRYTLAVLLAAETAADFAAILETQSAPYDDDGNPDLAEVDPFDSVTIDRGMMTSVPRGWKMSQFRAEQPTTTYKEFRDAILNEIARCVHVPANKARGDSSGFNFASGRLDHITYYESLDVERSQWEIDALDRIFAWWLDEALMIPGYLPPMESFADGLPHHWYWPGRKNADPTKDASAAATLHGLGLLTDEAYLLREGIDPEEHYRQLERQVRRRSELGLAPVSSAGGTASPPDDSDDEDEADAVADESMAAA